ncbi:MAG: LysR family transcriptional regulator, partial [Sutterellaceae bacterium]|nr:LysR family transcriptional regulator [Sutterellaceae bacterium]
MSESMRSIGNIELLDAICRTKELQRAAEECRISVSAASRQLRQMRAYFGDELFVRTGAGLVPTEKMRAKLPTIRQILSAMSKFENDRHTFLPADAKGVFRILTYDNGLLNYVVPILGLLHKEAPSLAIEFGVVSHGQQLVDELRRGLADLAIHPLPPKRADLVVYDLAPQSYVWMVRKGHPLLDYNEITVQDLMPFTQVMPGKDAGRPWTRLAELGMPSMVFPYFNTAPFILPQTDFLAWMPCATAKRWTELGQFAVIEPPSEL